MVEMKSPSRREFIAGAAAALTAGSAAAAAQTPGHYCIDSQSHLFVPEVVAIMQKRRNPPRIFREGQNWYLQVKDWVRAWRPEYADLPAKLSAMDKAGISLTMLSTNDPGPEMFGKEGPVNAKRLFRL